MTRLGGILVATTAHGVAAVLLGDDEATLRQDLAQRFPEFVVQPTDVRTKMLANDVVNSIDKPALVETIPIDVRGTPFQRQVWHALRGIPAGSTCSYTQLAHMLGMPRAVRAVASACAANPISVLIPCHRVVGADGRLRGYAWGLARKKALLDAETARVSA